jgi:TolB protein
MTRIKLFVILMLIISGTVFAQKNKIAYCSNETSSGFIQIFTMNEDGSDKKQLTDIQENCMKPKWSADGKQIVFYSDRGYIYLLRNAGTADKKTDPFYLWNGYNPTFLIDGDQIMYNDENENVLSIFVVDTVSAGAEPYLLSDGGYSNMQVLSKDGNKVAFSAFENGTKAVMVADLNDTTESYIKKVSINTDANLEPDISPDGNNYTYASFDNNLKGTIRINVGGKESLLTKGMGSTNVPRFSPDGSKIAFVAIGDNDVSLYIMNTDGSSRKDLNIKGGNVGTYEWMDKDRIVYDAGSETKTSVGIVNVNTGQSEIIATGGFNLQPSYQK